MLPHKIEKQISEMIKILGDINAYQGELNQLVELWDEKYPYNQREAKKIENGRKLKSIGRYNLGALSEDRSLTDRIDFLTEQLDDVEISTQESKNLIEDTD